MTTSLQTTRHTGTLATLPRVMRLAAAAAARVWPGRVHHHRQTHPLPFSLVQNHKGNASKCLGPTPIPLPPPAHHGPFSPAGCTHKPQAALRQLQPTLQQPSPPAALTACTSRWPPPAVLPQRKPRQPTHCRPFQSRLLKPTQCRPAPSPPQNSLISASFCCCSRSRRRCCCRWRAASSSARGPPRPAPRPCCCCCRAALSSSPAPRK